MDQDNFSSAWLVFWPSLSKHSYTYQSFQHTKVSNTTTTPSQSESETTTEQLLSRLYRFWFLSVRWQQIPNHAEYTCTYKSFQDHTGEWHCWSSILEVHTLKFCICVTLLAPTSVPNGIGIHPLRQVSQVKPHYPITRLWFSSGLVEGSVSQVALTVDWGDSKVTVEHRGESVSSTIKRCSKFDTRH